MTVEFRDRVDAGRQLADRLVHLRGHGVVVLGLPRGGVPVAAEVARSLAAPLDVIVVRKLGVPFQPELAMGAVGEDGVEVLNDEVVRLSGVTSDQLAAVVARARGELEQRVRRLRGQRPRIDVRGRTVVVVDDGIATGSTARAACQVARAHGAARVVLAVPVAPRSSLDELAGPADEVVCVAAPEPFYAVGQFYRDFTPTTDEQVAELLAEGSAPAPPTSGGPVARDVEVQVAVGELSLPGHLVVPDGASGLVLFAHGSGSSRHSPRNRFVAEVVQRAGLGTLLFDLLTEPEAADRAAVFDVGLLASRLLVATAWLRSAPGLAGLPVGYFGASTGAAAALWAAAESDVAAVVSRGGRPDLAGPRLARVRAPTLLIVGGRDDVVVELNRRAQVELGGPSQLVVIPGATHLFEEPGTLESAADLAADWFGRHLR